MLTKAEQAATLAAAAQVLRDLKDADMTAPVLKLADILDGVALILRLEDG